MKNCSAVKLWCLSHPLRPNKKEQWNLQLFFVQRLFPHFFSFWCGIISLYVFWHSQVHNQWNFSYEHQTLFLNPAKSVFFHPNHSCRIIFCRVFEFAQHYKVYTAENDIHFIKSTRKNFDREYFIVTWRVFPYIAYCVIKAHRCRWIMTLI